MYKLSPFTPVLILLSLNLLSGCGRGGGGYSILPDSSNFRQSADKVQSKVDLLWVIDNSASMETSQNNIANNFKSFISGFANNGYDFQIAVTTTSAWQTI